MDNTVSKVKVWDMPTRFFHWSLVIAIAVCWYSMEQRWLEVHKYAGMFILCLLVYRVLWGILGSGTARFKHFVRWPWHALSYLKRSLTGESEYHAGHNPAGGWMVVVLLLSIFLQVLTGLYANDDIGFSGPLADRVTKEDSDLATGLHGTVFNVILVLIWLHLVAVFFYVLVKMQNLVKAMITGKKPQTQVGDMSSVYFVPRYRIVIVYAVALLTGLYLFF